MGSRLLLADPSRIDTVEGWTRDDNKGVRRAALVVTLPWAKMAFPKEQDLAIRARVLSWAAGYVPDREWFIQKSVAWWLRDLSKHDAAATRAFLAEHGPCAEILCPQGSRQTSAQLTRPTTPSQAAPAAPFCARIAEEWHGSGAGGPGGPCDGRRRAPRPPRTRAVVRWR